MKKIVSMVCAATIAAGAAMSAAPAFAAPITPMPKAETANPVVDVQYRRGGYYRGGGYGYYNGHRGYRDYRPGYRRHGDYWFPAAAFLGGAIIGGMLADPGPRYYEPAPRYYEPAPRVIGRVGTSHTQWCYDRYRSYRAYDNTFQPYEGPRQQCYSPYN